MENLNKTYVVGTLKNVEIREGEKDNNKYIAGKFAVQVSEKNFVQHTFFTFEKTKKGQASKRYSNYMTLERLENSRVKVTGSINSREYYVANDGQVVHFNEVNTGFINPAKDTDENTSTFEIAGYVIKPLHERNNKEGELISYEMVIGQADYKNDLAKIKLTVNLENGAMIEAVQNNYVKNATISVLGEIRHETTPRTETVEVMIGDPVIKHFTDVIKTFTITGGKEVIVSDAAYSDKQISDLEDNYQRYILELEKDAKAKVESGESTVKDAPAKSNSSKLI